MAACFWRLSSLVLVDFWSASFCLDFGDLSPIVGLPCALMGDNAIAGGTRFRRRWPALIPLLLVALTPAVASGAAPTAATSTSRVKAHAGTTTKTKTKAKANANGKANAKASANPKTNINLKAKASASATASAKQRSRGHAVKAPPPPPSAPVVPPRATGKVAVFIFDGDGGGPLQARVVRLLRSRGLKVITNLRPFDSPEQYRETADALGLAAFMDGEASEDGDQGSVTVHVRSGISGLRVASATLSGERRKLGAEVDKSLWAQLGTPLAHACDDAAKPRKHEREPMRIEAGTPLENHPPDRKEDGAGKDNRKEDHDPKPPAPSASAAPG